MNTIKNLLRHLLILQLTTLGAISAQHAIRAQVLKIKPEIIQVYKTDSEEKNTLVLKMNFGSAEILNPEEAVVLKGKIIERVDLVFTAYQQSDTFSQPHLNAERLNSLEKLVPDLYRQSAIRYKIIGQNGCRSEYAAHNYFHGFVIRYKDAPTAESIKREASSINCLAKSDSLGKDTVYAVTEYRFKHRNVRTHTYAPILKSKRKRGIVYNSPGIWHRKEIRKKVTDTVVFTHNKKEFIPSPHAAAYIKKHFSKPTASVACYNRDTSVFAALNRNKKWNDILFVADVTGSMSPYSSQLMIWHKLNCASGRAKFFTFFNDGDMTPDHRKKTGATGGIYHSEARDYESVSKRMNEAMAKGFGGDGPENNCEALISAIEKHPEAKEIVMIADSWAPVKDISLINKIKKPVHIILCGAGGAINTDYLELARKTGGSIHTIEEDIENLAKLQEGSVIKIGNSTFRIEDGKFIPVFTS